MLPKNWKQLKLQDYVQSILRGVPNCDVITSDGNHTVVAVTNIHEVQSVVDNFKQRTGISYSQYKKPKLFGERGTLKITITE